MLIDPILSYTSGREGEFHAAPVVVPGSNVDRPIRGLLPVTDVVSVAGRKRPIAHLVGKGLNPPTTEAGKRHRSRFFVWIAIAMLAVVALGFGRSFFLRPLFIEEPLPLYLVAHGAVMTAWYLLFLAQAVLVQLGRTGLHRKLGIAGLGLAVAVVVSAVQVQLNIVPRRISAGTITGPEDLSLGVGFALASMSSLLPFVALIALAIWQRRKAAMHKRLMFWALVWTIGPAFAAGRPLGEALDPLVQPYLPFFPFDLIWFVALLAYDWKTKRRIHPVTWIGFLLLAFYALFIQEWIAGIPFLQDWLEAYLQAQGRLAGISV